MMRSDREFEGWLSIESSEPLHLLHRLAEHPNGVQLLQLFKEIYQNTAADRHPTVEIVKGRAASRVILLDALDQARERLIITSPWLSKRSIDEDILLRMTALLDRGCYLSIGWGYSHDIRGLHPNGKIISVTSESQCLIQADSARNYDAYPDLAKLRNQYPDLLELKLLGTHEKYLICDRRFALIGSHNVLSSRETLYAPRETGWKTNDPSLIDDQIQVYLEAPDLRYNLRLSSEFSDR
jgi:phosphatidylserine/phosphatidylglycerophosphate/cardiolipin synthase-like enzyme